MALAHPLSAPVSAVPDLSLQWYPELSWCTATFSPFSSKGCYNDTGSDSILPMRSSADQYHMTQLNCWAICKGNAFRYAGLIAGGVCYCGPSLPDEPVDSSYCELPCSDATDELCGGNDYMSIFEDTTFPSTAGLTTNDYVSLGCYNDNLNAGRALGYQQDLPGSTMTNEICIEACMALGFPYAGTEWSSQCFCGVVMNEATSPLYNPSDCSNLCNGNDKEICGGSGAISLYKCEKLLSNEPCGANILPPPKSSSYGPPPSSSTSKTSSSAVSSDSPPTLPPATSTSKPPTHGHPPPTTTPKPPPTTTLKPPPTTTPKPPPETTPKPPPATTPKPPPTTTETGPLCTTSVLVPPKCEYKCGEKFCSNPLPDWNDEQGCNEAYSYCKLQVQGCFKNAGWPHCMNCFDFHEWCNTIKYYCKKKSYYGNEFGKDHCFHNYPPVDCPPHTTTTTTYPCKTTPPAPPSPPQPPSCPPTPTGYCKQASNDNYGYSDQNPVGNIHMPILNCNNLESQHRGGDILKLYTHQDSSRCSSWKRQHAPDACEAACKEQYNECKGTYARGCKSDGKDEHNNEYGKGYPGHHSKGKGGSHWGGHHGGGKHGGGPGKGKNGGHPGGSGKGKNGGGGGGGGYGGGGKGDYFEYAADAGHTAALEARTHERWNQDGQKAGEACTQQYKDCVAVNRNFVFPKDKCVKYGHW
ncbi:hypothetical protein PG996_014734 [Apiospora saccharicola]|uniref:WSC domain-containing protein n=1 Tax=Apiospora saccharicola TaxID=335842 RepID=A0ABR1TL66_9PEZI